MGEKKMIGKKPMFICFVHGIIGTFIELKKSKNEGYVIPIYVPLNGVRRVEYPEAIPSDVIVHVYPDNSSYPGVSKAYVIVKENQSGEAPFLNKIGKEFEHTIERYRDKIQSDNIQLKTERQKVKTAKAANAKQVATEYELKNKRIHDDDSSGSFSDRMNFKRY